MTSLIPKPPDVAAAPGLPGLPGLGIGFSFTDIIKKLVTIIFDLISPLLGPLKIPLLEALAPFFSVFSDILAKEKLKASLQPSNASPLNPLGLADPQKPLGLPEIPKPSNLLSNIIPKI